MNILMTTTTPGSVDGIRVQSYEAGHEYDLSVPDGARALAAAFVGAGLAEPVEGELPPEAGEQPEQPEATPASEGAAPAAPPAAKPARQPKKK